MGTSVTDHILGKTTTTTGEMSRTMSEFQHVKWRKDNFFASFSVGNLSLHSAWEARRDAVSVVKPLIKFLVL